MVLEIARYGPRQNVVRLPTKVGFTAVAGAVPKRPALRKETTILDRDLDFCDQKIEESCDEMRPIIEAWKEAKRNLQTAEITVNKAKHEYNRCKYVLGQLENKLNQYRHRLNQMRKHRKELKLQKDFLRRQHKAVETQK